MTIQTRETLRNCGYYVPWVAVFVLLGMQSWSQSEYNQAATTEREQRIQYTDSIERLDGARAIADEHGKIREWNQGMVDLFGYSADEAIGRSVEFILSADLRESHRHAVEQAMRQPAYGAVHKIACNRAVTKSGDEINVTVRVRIERRKDAPVAISTFDRAANVERVELAVKSQNETNSTH